jgi:uncharacterized protein YegP (UPF0339 family)
MKKATFHIYKDKRGLWRNRLVAANGKTVMDGAEGYKRRRDARQAIKWFDCEVVSI